MSWKNSSVAGESERRCKTKDGQEQVIQGFAGHGEEYRFHSKCDEKPLCFKQEHDMTWCTSYKVQTGCCEQRDKSGSLSPCWKVVSRKKR